MPGLSPDDVAALAPAHHFGGRALLASVAAVERVSAALLAPGATSAAVGRAAGYRGPSAFCAAWRRATGFTPQGWVAAGTKERRAALLAIRRSGLPEKDTDRSDRVGPGLA